MSAAHYLQIALSSFVLVLAARRAHALLFAAPVSEATLIREIVKALDRGDRGRARAIAVRATPAILGRAVLVCLDSPSERWESLEEIRAEIDRGLFALRTLASISSLLGLMSALLELARFLAGDRGLEGLVAGLAERRALERAFFSMAIGLGTALFGGYAYRLLRREAQARTAELDRVEGALERYLPPT